MEEQTIAVKPEKYKISAEFTEKLKIFFMIVKPDSIPIPQFKAVGVLGYRMQDAMETAKKTYLKDSPGFSVVGNSNDFAFIEDILTRVHVAGITINPQVQVIKENDFSLIGKDGFIAGLKMASDVYVVNQKDKEEIKRIIATIK